MHTLASPAAADLHPNCPCSLLLCCRRSGCLVSGPEIEDPEGLAIARQTCFIASAGHAAVVAVALQDGRGSIQQTLALAEDAVPWGMAAWDPSTFPLHALAAREAATAATAARQPTHCKQQQEGQAQARPSAQPVNAFPSPARAALPQHTPAAAAAADDAADGFLAAAAQGCLLVAVQSDVAKKQWWLPPAGPASGSLLCIPLGSGSGGPGQTCMLEWREWSRVKVKRPSGVTIDHAGVRALWERGSGWDSPWLRAVVGLPKQLDRVVDRVFWPVLHQPEAASGIRCSAAQSSSTPKLPAATS